MSLPIINIEFMKDQIQQWYLTDCETIDTIIDCMFNEIRLFPLEGFVEFALRYFNLRLKMGRNRIILQNYQVYNTRGSGEPKGNLK